MLPEIYSKQVPPPFLPLYPPSISSRHRHSKAAREREKHSPVFFFDWKNTAVSFWEGRAPPRPLSPGELMDNMHRQAFPTSPGKGALGTKNQRHKQKRWPTAHRIVFEWQQPPALPPPGVLVSPSPLVTAPGSVPPCPPLSGRMPRPPPRGLGLGPRLALALLLALLTPAGSRHPSALVNQLLAYRRVASKWVADVLPQHPGVCGGQEGRIALRKRCISCGLLRSIFFP